MARRRPRLWHQPDSDNSMATPERPSKKKAACKGRRKSLGYDNPSISADDEEVDETFVALQNLLDALNRTNRSTTSNSNSGNTNGSGAGSSSHAPNVGASTDSDSTHLPQQQRLSREEMLESRRQERDRFRRSLFTKSNTSSAYNSRRRRTCPAYGYSEDEDEDESQAPSVESTISNRFMNGSFSTLNVHVISRNRWSTEDRVVERLPIVMLPKSGKFSIPTDNQRIGVVHTDEYIDLRDKLVENLPPGASLLHYLTPPRSTWYMHMHDFEALQC
ncbi:unnamed protein product [Hyaloperonospora brassicae]|uniref:Uncharacterized protein n=1 Tax=Hyaloperonospora brassicae TaxID=162125 RepID=A0AAV0T0W8_HYABA|nr:unnamed protein product [Hyaloperonospora brassicae]